MQKQELNIFFIMSSSNVYLLRIIWVKIEIGNPIVEIFDLIK